MSKIFISYRRADAGAAARLMHDRLASDFGINQIFMDVDKIAVGQRFKPVIDEALSQCRVMLCVIGPRWLDILHERAGDPADFVVLEIATAVERGIDIIPVILDGADLPQSEHLPEAIASLSQYQRAVVRHEFFNRDVDLLIDRIRIRYGITRRRRLVRGMRLFGILATVSAISLGSIMAYSEYQRIQQEAHSRAGLQEYQKQEKERENERKRAERARFEAAIAQWTPTIHVRDNPQRPRHWMTVSAEAATLPWGTSMRPKLLGVNFQIENDKPTKYFEPTKDTKVSIDLLDKDGSVLRSKDMTEEFWRVVKQNIDKALGRETPFCDIFGCSIAETTCHPMITNARLKVGSAAISFDRSACSVSAPVHICLSAYEIPAPLVPGTTLPLELELLTGEVKKVTLPVKFTRRVLGPEHPSLEDLKDWSLLKEAENEYPVAAAKFQPPSAVIGQYIFVLPLNTCGNIGESSTLFLDVDGRGFVKLERVYGGGVFNGGLQVPTIDHPSPRSLGSMWGLQSLPPDVRIIRYKAEKDGRTLGPFSYRFDPIDLVHRAGGNVAPDIRCDDPYRPGQCFASSKLGYFSVAKLRFGDAPEAFTHELAVSYSAKDYLSFCPADSRAGCQPFSFEVPNGWSDLYFEIVMKDGSVARKGRITLPPYRRSLRK